MIRRRFTIVTPRSLLVSYRLVVIPHLVQRLSASLHPQCGLSLLVIAGNHNHVHTQRSSTDKRLPVSQPILALSAATQARWFCPSSPGGYKSTLLYLLTVHFDGSCKTILAFPSNKASILRAYIVLWPTNSCFILYSCTINCACLQMTSKKLMTN